MIKNYSLLLGFISSIFLSLYVFMYILRNIYCSCKNKTLRVFINKLLPIISRYNSLFLILGFICSLLHIFPIFINTSIFNTGYAVLFVLLIIMKFNFFDSKEYNSIYKLNIFAYLLFLALIIHYFI